MRGSESEACASRAWVVLVCAESYIRCGTKLAVHRSFFFHGELNGFRKRLAPDEPRLGDRLVRRFLLVPAFFRMRNRGGKATCSAVPRADACINLSTRR